MVTPANGVSGKLGASCTLRRSPKAAGASVTDHEPVDAALQATRKQTGRVVGGLIGGQMIELLSLAASAVAVGDERPKERGVIGNQSVALSVTDLDATYRQIVDAGYTPDQEPFGIQGVRMLFVKDPDGTAVEFVELPGDARTTYEMHRGQQQ